MRNITPAPTIIGLLLVVCGLAPRVAAEVPFALQVNDKVTGEAIANVDVTIATDNSNQKFKTDDSGRVSLTLPAPPRFFSVSTKLDHYVPMSVNWGNGGKATVNVPESYTLSLEPGTKIGGTVTDDQNKPIANVTVRILVPSNSNGDGVERVSIWDYPVKTNDKGQWRTDSIMPAKLADGGVMFRLSHPDYASDETYGATNPPPIGKLRDMSAVMVMKKGLMLTGKILDKDGKPIAGAQVLQGRDRWGSNYPQTKTDGTGAFTFKNAKAGEVILTVQAKGYSPDVQTVNIAEDPSPVEFRLEPAKVLKLKIVDQNGKPVSGVRVVADTWRQLRAISFQATSDAAGAVTWKDAPADAVQFDMLKQGYGDVRNKPLTASDEPITITLHPPAKITGTVVAAATGESIKQFKVVEGIGFDPRNETPYFERQQVHAGTDGQFSYTIGMPYPKHFAKIEADGYAPAISRAFTTEEGDVKLEFKLTKAAPLAGILHTADGKPVAGAAVLLASGRSNAVQVESGQLTNPRREDGNFVETDAAGHFSFPSETSAFLLVAVTEEGIARYESQPTTQPAGPIDLVLQPWGRVEGTLKVGNKPTAGQTVAIEPARMSYTPNAPYFSARAHATTDEKGHFAISGVMPGPARIGREVRSNSQGGMFTIGLLQADQIDVEPGKTIIANVGGTGRPVTGHIELPKDSQLKPQGMLMTHFDLPRPAVPSEIQKGTPEQMQLWSAKWQQTDEGKAFTKAQMNRKIMPLVFDSAGAFRVDDVTAGNYNLTVYASGINAATKARVRAALSGKASVVVPPIPNGYSDEPLDVGLVPLQAPSTRPTTGPAQRAILIR